MEHSYLEIPIVGQAASGAAKLTFSYKIVPPAVPPE
jgi:hypothetical protein